MKKLLLILAAALCLAGCEDKYGFTYDKVYDDPEIFHLPIKMDAPTQVTEDGAVFKVMIKTKEEIAARGVLIAEESYSNNPEIFYSDETGNIFEVAVSGLRAGTGYYARSFILTEGGELITSLERTFVTLGTKEELMFIKVEHGTGTLDYENGYYIDSQGLQYKYAFILDITITVSSKVDDSQVSEVGYEYNDDYYTIFYRPPFAGQTFNKKIVIYNQTGGTTFYIRGIITLKDGRRLCTDYNNFILKARDE